MIRKSLLFLGYDRETTRLLDLVERQGWTTIHTSQPVADFSKYDLIVSFGYRHILKQAVLETARRPVLNLHIAYLPWNRGAHPVFWAAYDGTPFGVTIHEIDTGVDTGSICFQRVVQIDIERETFSTAHQMLTQEIEDLFEFHLGDLLSGNYMPRSQTGVGSLKRVSDLPSGFIWSEKIGPVVRRLKQAANV